MAQPWYRKVTVQASLAGALLLGTFTLLATLLSRSPTETPATPAPHHSAPAAKPATQIPGEILAATGDEAYSPITLEQFYATYYDKALTTLQQEELARQFLGRRVIWEGVVKSVESDPSGTITVIIESQKSDWTKVFMKFDEQHKSHLLRIKPRQTIRATGILRNVVASPFVRECTLLKVWD